MNKRPLVGFAQGCFVLLAAISAAAQSQYYWDATSPIMNSPGSGGTGNWSTSTADWWVSGSTDSVWANGNIANFAGTAGTVTLTSAVTANGLTFSSTSYIIGGSSMLTLAGSPVITLPGAPPTTITTIACPVAGSAPVTISGVGDLSLTGVNTYTGGTTIGSGSIVAISGAGKLGNGTYSGAITNQGLFIYSSSASQTLSGVVSGTGMLSVTGTGTLTLTKNDTYSGGTLINPGSKLTVGIGGGLPGAGNVTNNGTLNYNGTNSQTWSGIISGTGALSVNPGGAQGSQLTLAGANTYAGPTTIALAGQVIISSDGNLGTPPATFTSNQLVMNYGFLKATSTFTLNANRGITFGNSVAGLGGSIQVNPFQALTIAAPITGPNGFISGSGEANFGYGTNILAANCTYTGATGISTGTLMLGVNGALPTGTTLIMAPDDLGGSVFDLGGFSQTIGPLSTTNSFAGPTGTGTPTIVLNGALTILQTNVATVFNGTITGPGTLTINGNGGGKLTLALPNSYTGGATINGGTLDGSVSGSVPGSVQVNGGTLELDDPAAMSSTASLTLGVGVTMNLNYSGTQTISALTLLPTHLPQEGLWGAPGNGGATFTDSRFTGPGLLLVCPAPDQTITPAASSVCAGATTTASVIDTLGATYSWSVSNGTIISGGTSNTVTYSAWANGPVLLNCVVTSSCGAASAGGQNSNVTINVCGPLVQSTNVVYDPVNGATISGTGVMGAAWYLNASTNVAAPLPWPTIQSGTVTASPFTVTDPNAVNQPQQFYYLTNSP